MSLSYANTPVYIGQINTSAVNTGFTGAVDYIPATNADVTFNTSLNAKRKLGIDITNTDQLTVGGALTAEININSLIYPTLDQGFRYLSGVPSEARDSFVPIKIGENIYKKCYPKSITVNIEPLKPATITATFTSLDPPTGTKLSGDSRGLIETYNYPLSGDRFVYGHTSSMINGNTVVGNVQSSVVFTRNYNRTPVYGIGSPSPTSMLLDGIDEEMSITSTGLQNFINLSGDILASQVTLHMQDTELSMGGLMSTIAKMPVGSRVVSQKYGSSEGDTVSTTATIKNIEL